MSEHAAHFHRIITWLIRHFELRSPRGAGTGAALVMMAAGLSVLRREY